MGVLLSLYLYSIFVPYFDLYFFIIVVAVSLSFGFLQCKGMAVLSDTKHQAMPYSAKTFPERLPQMLHIWVFQKTMAFMEQLAENYKQGCYDPRDEWACQLANEAVEHLREKELYYSIF